MSKMLLVLTSLVLTCGLVLGTAGTALAAQSTDGRGLFATVENVTIDADGNGLIAFQDADPVTVNTNTTYHIPTFVPPWQTWVELADTTSDDSKLGQVYVEGADRVGILLEEPVSERIAAKVMVIPDEPIRRHRAGVVVSVNVEEGTVTIVNKAGHEITIDLPEGFQVAPGEYVTLVARRFRVANEVRLRAMAVQNMAQLATRLRTHMEAAQRQQDFERAGELLEQAYQRQRDVLEGIKTRLEAQQETQTRAMQAVDQAIDDLDERHQETLRLMEQIRERVRTGWESWLAQWSVVQGNITAIDLEAQTVTVESADGDAVDLEVVNSTQIMKDGVLATISDLAVGDTVKKAYYNTEGARLIVVCSAQLELPWSQAAGMISAVDVEAGTVSILTTSGETIVLDIVESTQMVRNVRLAEIDDLSAGDVVRKAVYYTETYEAIGLVVCSVGQGSLQP